MKTRIGIFTTVAAGITVGTSQGALVAEYAFSGNLDPTSIGTNIASASTFGGLSDGNIAPTYSATSGFAISANGSEYAGAPINNVTSTGSAAGSVFARRFITSGSGDGFQHYYGFSITVASGYELNLSDIVFDIGLRAGSASAIKVEYSTTSNFSSGVVKIGEGAGYIPPADPSQAFLGYGTGGTLGVKQATVGSQNAFSWNRITNTANLAGNEQLQGTVYFRVWAKGGTGGATSGQSNVYLDNVNVNGTVSVVPEPASIALIGLAGISMRRRRR